MTDDADTLIAIGTVVALIGAVILLAKLAELVMAEFGWWGAGALLVAVGILIAIGGTGARPPRTEYP